MGRLINALSIFLVIKLIIGFIEIFDYISKGKCSVWNYFVNVEMVSYYVILLSLA